MSRNHTSLEEMREMTFEQLQAVQIRIETSLVEMKGALELARINKIDKVKHQKLAYAHRITGLHHQQLLRELKKKKMDLKKKEEATIERAFIELAKNEMDEDFFIELMGKARAKVS